MNEQEDKRIRRTKKLLRQALTALVQQKDFQGITVTDVVREADINRGTFYAHYRDVYDLRDQIEAEMIADFRAMIDDFRPSAGDTSLRPVLVRAADYLEENRDMVTALLRASGPEGFGRRLIEVIEECRLEVVPNHTVKDAYIARFIATGLVGMLQKWISEDKPVSKGEMIEWMANVLGPLLPGEHG
ncbi:TetR/AcrR family transcriptional regulator [Agathobaculum sp.]|uniref:TetR/AcrR family transcriptional regulator n=1 Tax=Agathobaculum sp. TaxID=2048138 RepID=UPI002A7F85E0|nr:TetR/AcrR family transcriptional regulator [Agathobaculum sp.]MDY3617847.1 TetR/AcrR family transcriptional regulator [Agathobaculum sp.]